MKTTIKIFATLLFFSTLFISCSSSEETQIKKQDVEKDTVYVFDEIPPEDLFKFESPVQQSFDVYVIQIGAFASIDHAKEFADECWNKLNKEIKVEYKEDKNLYVVWIYPPFQDKMMANEYRNEIQRNGEFKDAWIVTIPSKK